jgi:type IV pilus assembly protein PilE
MFTTCTSNTRMNKLHAFRGFTLIELMITVAIVAILATIAYPGYQEYVARTRRGDAKGVLLEAAQWAERQYTVSNTYVATLPTGFSTSPKDSTAVFYNVAFVSAPSASAPSASQFFLRATPTNGMTNDKCGSFIVSSTGAKTLSGNAAGTSVASCWDR